MNKKHVLLLTTTGGFVPQFEMDNVRILQNMGAVVHYASNFDNPVYQVSLQELKEKGIIIHNIPVEKSPFDIKHNSRAYKELLRIVKEENISIIHCHNPVGGVLGRLLGRHFYKSGLKVAYTAHGFHFYQGAPVKNWVFYYTVERLLAHFTDAIITINEEDYKAAIRFKLRPGGKVYKIPGVGIRRERLTEDGNASDVIRDRYGIPKDAFHIVSVGELNSNKNHRIVIEAVKKLQNLPICYTICGDGKSKSELSKLISDLRLEDRVHLAGYQTDIAPFLKSADCFAFPSIREGLGMAALEAMAMGLPVIASDNRGTREYMQDGINGYCCQSSSSDEFADAIKKLYNNRKLCKEMAAHAKETAGQFDIIHVSEVMERVYQRLLG